ncbi:MAG TPA: alpha/beta hydrolase-fold protein [Ktedonobacterales bacterium]|nr:alpha/beta hydrolase-fold protein [Ktedonobacterales bacterium]
MNRDYARWYSPSLGRDMELLVFGHSGARVLVFPTSQGRFFEWEDRCMMDTLRHHLEQGWIQIFCVDSVDGESWYNKGVHPAVRAARHAQYDAYLRNEVLPYTTSRNDNPYFITTGASFGAYHAFNFALRYPDVVNRALGMSGLYDISGFVDGYSDDNVYFNNPVAYIPNEHEPGRLDALRRLDLILATGRDDRFRSDNDYFSGLLWNKGIGNALRLWDGWAHDWPYWRQMILHYIGGHD